MEKKINNVKGMVFAALFAALLAVVARIMIPLGFTPVPITLQTTIVLLAGVMLGANYGALSMLIYLIVGALGIPVFAGGSGGYQALIGPTGGYLLSYPVAAFVIGKMLENKKMNIFFKYFSFATIFLLVSVVAVDSLFKAGIIPFLLTISPAIRLLVSVLSIGLILWMLSLLLYSKMTKYFSFDTVMAMFTGTLIIYVMGALGAKIFVTGQPLPWSAIFVGWVLPFIIGDAIKLLIAAYLAKTVEVKQYLK